MMWLKWIAIGLGIWSAGAIVATTIICRFIHLAKKREESQRAEWRQGQEAAGLPTASKEVEDQMFARTSLF
jgi:hypothetical protein